MDRSWFHTAITGVQAENLLKNEGKHGSFLFRPSQNVSGLYALSVRVGDSVTHMRTKNEGEYICLSGAGDETFATLGELVRYYMEDNTRELRDTNGTIIELKYPLPCVDHHNERFFHHNLDGHQAEQRMTSVTSLPGTFLVRDSQSQCDCFVLSVVIGRQDVKVLHVKITFQDGKYGIGDNNLFSSLSELVNHYRRYVMKDKSGIEVTLKQAVDWTRLKASDIDYRVAQLEKEFTLNGAQRSGFWEEFEHLQVQENIEPMSRSAGEKPENKKKNRYKNILPFDATRVILTDVDPSVSGSDYINANLIEMPDDSMPGGRRRYIASQGCLLHTIQDFWLMALQQESSIIVMITKIVEDGKNKCALYWPEGGDSDTDKYNVYEGTITVTLKDTNAEKEYIKRVFEVVKQPHKGKPQSRTFYHYQYMDWKDKKVPTAVQTTDVLRFVKDVDTQWRATHYAGPMIVHCSAGIGRTGTFIVIDLIINQIMRHGLETEIDIFKTILNIRQQRSGFVQTPLQYKFIYVAVKRYIEMLKSQPAELPPSVADNSDGQIYQNAAMEPIGKSPASKPKRKTPPNPSTYTKPTSPGTAPKPQMLPKPLVQENGNSRINNSTTAARPQNNPDNFYQNLDAVKSTSAKKD